MNPRAAVHNGRFPTDDLLAIVSGQPPEDEINEPKGGSNGNK